MKARLIVKGNRFEVARAAADRGIPFAFERETDHETIGVCQSTVDDLTRWVCEDTTPPFPTGSLLLWTPIN